MMSWYFGRGDNLSLMGLCISGEIGEFNEILKKIGQRRPICLENLPDSVLSDLRLELGDILFYVLATSTYEVSSTPSEILHLNFRKLVQRRLLCGKRSMKILPWKSLFLGKPRFPFH